MNLIMFVIVHPQYCYGQSIDYTINHPSIHLSLPLPPHILPHQPSSGFVFSLPLSLSLAGFRHTVLTEDGYEAMLFAAASVLDCAKRLASSAAIIISSRHTYMCENGVSGKNQRLL